MFTQKDIKCDTERRLRLRRAKDDIEIIRKQEYFGGNNEKILNCYII